MLIEGWRSVAAAFEAGAPVFELLITPKMMDDPAVAALVLDHVVVYEISEKVARQLSTVDTAPGIMAVAGINATDLKQLEGMRRILVLDGVQDPGNVGTIVRTAAWFGIEAVLGNADTADFYSPKVVRASMGGIWDTALVREPAFIDTLMALKNTGFSLVGADLQGIPLDTWQPAGRVALVIGGEANGISTPVAALLDACITIPGRGARHGTESLNAAIAAGIMMQHWTNT